MYCFSTSHIAGNSGRSGALVSPGCTMRIEAKTLLWELTGMTSPNSNSTLRGELPLDDLHWLQAASCQFTSVRAQCPVYYHAERQERLPQETHYNLNFRWRFNFSTSQAIPKIPN